MRYRLPTDRLINQLVPHFLGGRRYILFLQSLVWPLKSLNERFEAFAREKHIEARMTSQVIYFEWYLNHKFRKYFVNAADAIFIRDSTSLGVDIYPENSAYSKPFTIWFEGEAVTAMRSDENPREFYRMAEEKAIGKVSFMVCVPPIGIDVQEFVYMLSYAVNTYRVAGKTYLIKIDSSEIEPTKNRKQ